MLLYEKLKNRNIKIQGRRLNRKDFTDLIKSNRILEKHISSSTQRKSKSGDKESVFCLSVPYPSRTMSKFLKTNFLKSANRKGSGLGIRKTKLISCYQCLRNNYNLLSVSTISDPEHTAKNKRQTKLLLSKLTKHLVKNIPILTFLDLDVICKTRELDQLFFQLFRKQRDLHLYFTHTRFVFSDLSVLHPLEKQICFLNVY